MYFILKTQHNDRFMKSNLRILFINTFKVWALLFGHIPTCLSSYDLYQYPPALLSITPILYDDSCGNWQSPILHGLKQSGCCQMTPLTSIRILPILSPTEYTRHTPTSFRTHTSMFPSNKDGYLRANKNWLQGLANRADRHLLTKWISPG